MAFSTEERAACERLIDLALAEDLAERGDLTSLALLPEDATGSAALVARSPGTLAGMPVVGLLLTRQQRPPQWQPLLSDGTRLKAGERIGVLRGALRQVLSLERTILNFLQHLSGIATLTQTFVDTIAGLPVKILDTRKTLPGWRLLAKYAVRQGGGANHRIGLFDGFLIKDNHVAGLGPDAVSAAAEAVRRAQRARADWSRRGVADLTVEVEVDRLDQLDAVLPERPDIVLLDNMSLDQMRQAVARRDQVAPGVLLEASGGVTLATVRGIAETGVDRISIGALTHSAPALDIALDYELSV